MPTLKVYLIGARGTGKTTFVNHHMTGIFQKAYISTMGIHIKKKIMNVNGKEYELEFIDMSPDTQNYGAFDGKMYSLEQIDNSSYDYTCALAFYNPNKESHELTNHIIKKFKEKCNDVPVINVLNKIDSEQTGYPGLGVNIHRISVLNDENCVTPLLNIINNYENVCRVTKLFQQQPLL